MATKKRRKRRRKNNYFIKMKRARELLMEKFN
jgi:hypothetical protein